MTSLAIEGLRARLSPAASVLDTEADRLLYSRDCWTWWSLQARDGRGGAFPPEAIAYPATIEDVQTIVRWSRERGVPVVPFGAGSGVAGAAVPLHGGLVVDCKRLDGLDVSGAPSGMVRAGAGWLGLRLEHELQRRGWTLGHFPSSIGCSTLGGWVATRSAGQASTRYGKIEDMVVAVRWVDTAGDVRTTFGDEHDPLQMLIGSEGTLGVIVDVWLKVEPAPASRRARGYAFADIDSGLDAIRRVMQGGHRPSVVRLYDAFDTWISGARKAVIHRSPATDGGGLTGQLRAYADALFGERTVKRSALAAASQALARTVGAPLVLNRVADQAHDDCLLVLGIEERDEALADAAFADVHGVLAETGIDLGAGPGEHWYAHRYAVSYKMSPMIDAGWFVDTMEVSSNWSRLAAMHREVRAALERHVFVMAHFSHAYPSGGSIYFTFAGFGRDEASCRARYRQTWDAGLDAVLRAGGAATHHHGVGVLKAGRLYADHPGGRPLYEAVKRAVDPADLHNPGKLWRAKEMFP